MAIIDEETKKQIKKMFNELDSKVTLTYYNKETKVAPHIKNMLTELSELSEKIELKQEEYTDDAKKQGIDDAPSIKITSEHIKGNIVYFGIPSGYEFGAFLQGIIIASKGKTELNSETKKFLSGLKDKLLLEVFVTPTCPHCPVSAYLSYSLAIESEKVTAHVYEASEFQEISQKYKISGVPHTEINKGKGNYIGGYPEKEAIEKIKEVLNN